HEDRGLGLEFLRHIERTQVLVFVLDASGIDGRHPLEDLKTLRSELQAYNPVLLEKPCVVALNKIDAEESAEKMEEFRAAYDGDFDSLFEISAQEQLNLAACLDKIREKAQRNGKHF
ncbi:MAG: GTPase ObgE, partial [Chlamydiia bacterium]|nr:GTPase ObgE [Chlamydiia bacterium]